MIPDTSATPESGPVEEASAQALHKRKYLRLEIQRPAKWVVLRPGEDSALAARETTTVDLSAGGVSFEVNERLDVGTYLELELSPLKPDQPPVTCRGVVNWCRKMGKEDRFVAGVRLLHPPEISLHRLLLDAYEHLGEFRTVCDQVRSCGELKYNCEAWLTGKNCWQIENPPCCHWHENRDCLHCPVTALCFLG